MTTFHEGSTLHQLLLNKIEWEAKQMVSQEFVEDVIAPKVLIEHVAGYWEVTFRNIFLGRHRGYVNVHVPATWWDHFKQQHELHPVMRWLLKRGWLRPYQLNKLSWRVTEIFPSLVPAHYRGSLARVMLAMQEPVPQSAEEVFEEKDIDFYP